MNDKTKAVPYFDGCPKCKELQGEVSELKKSAEVNWARWNNDELIEDMDKTIALLSEFDEIHVPQGEQGDCRTCEYDNYIQKFHANDCLLVRINTLLKSLKEKYEK